MSRKKDKKNIDEGRHFVSVRGTIQYSYYEGDIFKEIRSWTDERNGRVVFPKSTSNINNKQICSNNLLIQIINRFPFPNKILNQII